MKKLLNFFLFIVPSCILAQSVEIHLEANFGNIALTDDFQIPKAGSGYSVWLPVQKPAGAIVFFHDEPDGSANISIIPLAREKQLAVLFISTENRLEFLFTADKMREVEKYIHEACVRYAIPENNLLFTGMSLEGTRALKMAVFASSADSKYHIKPKAVAICDAPLDMVRFWTETDKAWRMNLNETSANEGKWVSQYLAENLGGKPDEVLPAYVNYSPFCYSATNGGNARYLLDIAVRAYTEPDVHWWIDNRAKDYYSMNAIDAAALINQLRISGNRKAELITTENKGYRPDGSRHPHSWSIVDERELLDWFLHL